MNVTDIIADAGGHEAVSEKTGLSVGMVQFKWPRDGIQDKYWADLMILSKNRGKVLTVRQIYDANLQTPKRTGVHA